MDIRDPSESPIDQENARQDEQNVRIDDQVDGSFSSRQEENVAGDIDKSQKTDKILELQSHNQKETVDASKEENEGMDKDGSLRPKKMDEKVSNATGNIRIGKKGVESKGRKDKSVDDAVKNVKLDDKTEEQRGFQQEENVNMAKKVRSGDKIEESQKLAESVDDSMEKNVMTDETDESSCSKDMENSVNNNNTTEIIRIDANNKESQYPKEKNLDDNGQLTETFTCPEEDFVLKCHSVFTPPRTKLDKSLEEPETKDISAFHKNEIALVEQEIRIENVETVKPVQLVKEKMLEISLDNSSDNRESSDSCDESDSPFEIDDDDYYNWEDYIEEKEDTDDDQIKESIHQKTILDSGTSGAPLVDVDCGETFSISGDSNKSGDIAAVPTNVDDSTIENKGAKPKTYFVHSPDKDNNEPATELLTEKISREVRRFFLLNPITLEDASPLERHYRIITSTYFSDEFAREIGIALPEVSTDNVREDYEQRLDEMMANSKRLKDLLAVIPSAADNRNSSRPQSAIGSTRKPTATREQELADTASAACSAKVTDPTSRVRPWTDYTTELQFSHLYDECYHTKQRPPLKLEESVESLRKKQTAETETNFEEARRHLQAVGVSEEEFIRYFPIIQRKYGYVDDDRPVSELDDSMDPKIEDKIMSTMFDKGTILMTEFYVELKNKRNEVINSYFNDKVADIYSGAKDSNLAMASSDCEQPSESLPLLKVNHPCLLRDIAKSIEGTTARSAHRSRPVSAEETKAIQNIQTAHADESMTCSPDLDVVFGSSTTKLRLLEPSTDTCNFEHRSDMGLSTFTTTADENCESNVPYAIKSNFAYTDSSEPISGDTCSSPSASENAVTRAPQAVDQSNVQDSTLDLRDEAISDASSKHSIKAPVLPPGPNYDSLAYLGEHYGMARISDYFFNMTDTYSAFSSALNFEEACSAENPSLSDDAVIHVTRAKNLIQSNIKRMTVILEGEENSDGSKKDNVPTSTQPPASVADSTICSETKLHTTEHLTADSDILNQPHTAITFSGLVSEETCSVTSLSSADSRVSQSKDQADEPKLNISAVELIHGLSKRSVQTATVSDESNIASTTQTEIELHKENS